LIVLLICDFDVNGSREAADQLRGFIERPSPATEDHDGRAGFRESQRDRSAEMGPAAAHADSGTLECMRQRRRS
jgi:hypothetical protein